MNVWWGTDELPPHKPAPFFFFVYSMEYIDSNNTLTTSFTKTSTQAVMSWMRLDTVGNLSTNLGRVPNLNDLPFTDTTQKIQAFTMTYGWISGTTSLWVAFPKAFKPGTTPVVVAMCNMEGGGGGWARTICIENVTGATNNPDLNNTGFSADMTFLYNDNINFSTAPGVIHVVAVGEF